MDELRDDDRFAELVQPHREAVRAHCYRMLGSVHDADDALQETLLRAWRGIDGLRGPDAARSWLHAIAHNVCLTEITRRGKRALPHDLGPAVDGHTQPGEPVIESAWVEPYPDEALGLSDAREAPEARYDQHEAVELAFIAALQHLGANQRSVLLLRDVLGYSAEESASLLETSVPSVTSALQRARAAVADRVPPRTQQATLRVLGDRGLHELVERWVNAWERCDVDAFAAMLTEDASFAMPPLATWYRTREQVATWAREYSMNGWRWRGVLTRANGQPAIAFYAWDETASAYLPFALNVLTLRDDLVSDVTAFIVRTTGAPEPDAYVRFPDRPLDERRLEAGFTRFGLPDRIVA